MRGNAREYRATSAWWWYGAAAAMACAVFLFGYRSHLAHRRLVTDSFQAQQSLFALSIQNALIEHLGEEEKDLQLGVREVVAGGIHDEEVDRVLGNLLASHIEDFLSLALFDGRGNLVRANPSVGLWGPGLLERVRGAILANADAGRTFLSEGFVSTVGDTSLALCVPFRVPGEGGGLFVIVGALRIEDFIRRHFPSWQGRSVGFVLADDDGRILSLMSTEHLTDGAMKRGNILAPEGECLGCHTAEDFADIARSFDKRGVNQSIFRSPEGMTSNRATISFDIYNERWALAVISPYESIQLAIDRNQSMSFALALLLAATLGAVGWIEGERSRMRAAERESVSVRASEERFRAVFESANDGILIVDPGGTIRDANRTLYERLGYAREELVGRSVAALDDPAGAALVPERMAAIIRDGRGVFEVEHRRKDGSTMPVEISARVIALDDGPAILSVVRDVTERAAADRALRRYAREIEEANRLKDLFNDIVRHDLLNPLSVARGYAELLPEAGDAAGRELVAALRRSLSRLAEMIRSAAHLSRLMETEGLETEEQDLGVILADAVRPFEAEFAAGEWTVTLPPPQPRPIRANPLIGEVFANLVANALKFAGERRRIEITARDTGRSWVVVVRDWGPGISAAERERAFARFERLGVRSTKGMGLGLAIARRIVELHGGSIRIDDNPEGGCIFLVELPKGSAPPSGGEAAAGGGAKGGAG